MSEKNKFDDAKTFLKENISSREDIIFISKILKRINEDKLEDYKPKTLRHQRRNPANFRVPKNLAWQTKREKTGETRNEKQQAFPKHTSSQTGAGKGEVALTVDEAHPINPFILKIGVQTMSTTASANWKKA